MKLERITVAVTHMDEMVRFYNGVFESDLQQMGESPFYMGQFAGVEMMFCPNEIAEVRAEQNRQQFKIRVDRLDGVLEAVVEYGGQVKNEPGLAGSLRVAGIVDPDGNTIELVGP